MKFLCVPCDTPMKLQATAPPDRGSLSVVYGCPACGYEMAMLTNPYETQLVQSLGVKIGPGDKAEGSGCPFPGMVAAAEAASEAGIPWTEGATARLAGIPSFVRSMAKTGIERFAIERGYAEVDERVMDEAKGFFGM